MDAVLFQKHRQQRWLTLEKFVRGRRLPIQEASDLSLFVQLYRETANDLAYAQTYFPNTEMTQYLNDIVGLAHNRLYRQSDSGFRAIWVYLIETFPAMFRLYGFYIACSAALMVLGGVYGYLLVLWNPMQAYRLLPPSLAQAFHPDQVGPHAVDAPFMSSFIMTHNMQVVLLSFIGGLGFGLFTLYSLWQNGLLLGVIAAVYQAAGKTLIFWSLIVPHGVTELTAIAIAGGAGFLFAHRLLHPGLLGRWAAIRDAAVQGTLLMLGTIPMLAIAGTLEGFLTPSNAPLLIKYGVAMATAIFWVVYFTWMGRSKSKLLQRGPAFS